MKLNVVHKENSLYGRLNKNDRCEMFSFRWNEHFERNSIDNFNENYEKSFLNILSIEYVQNVCFIEVKTFCFEKLLIFFFGHSNCSSVCIEMKNDAKVVSLCELNLMCPVRLGKKLTVK